MVFFPAPQSSQDVCPHDGELLFRSFGSITRKGLKLVSGAKCLSDRRVFAGKLDWDGSA